MASSSQFTLVLSLLTLLILFSPFLLGKFVCIGTFAFFRKKDLPPKCLDDQPPPKSFMKWVRRVQNVGKKPRKSTGMMTEPTKGKRNRMQKATNEDRNKECDDPIFKRKKGETARHFLERVNFEADQRLFASQKKAQKHSTKRKE